MLSLPDLESTYDLLAEAIDNAPAGTSELMLTKLALCWPICTRTERGNR